MTGSYKVEVSPTLPDFSVGKIMNSAGTESIQKVMKPNSRRFRPLINGNFEFIEMVKC